MVLRRVGDEGSRGDSGSGVVTLEVAELFAWEDGEWGGCPSCLGRVGFVRGRSRGVPVTGREEFEEW